MTKQLTEEQEAEATAEIKEQLITEFGVQEATKVLANYVPDELKEEAMEEYQELKKEVDFDLDLALDTYDPTFPGYTPSEEAFEFFSTMRLVQGQDFEFNTPIAHYFMADLLLGYITDKQLFPYSKEVCDTLELNDLRIGVMASRGMAKSTVVISFFTVYSAMKGKLNNNIGKIYFYLLIAASSKGGARVNALAVRAMCEDIVYLKDCFEEMRFTETETEFIRKCPSGKVGKDATTPRKNRSFLIRYQGYSTGIRGSRYGERRPDAVIFDDAILNSASAYSKVMSANLDEIIHADSINALKGGGRGRVILCFTPFHYGDVNTKALIQGAFTQCIIPMARAFDSENVTITSKLIDSSWEAMHPSKSIVQLIRGARKAKKLQLFMQERMLRLTSGAYRLIPDECIQYCDMKLIGDNIGAYTTLITSDFTTSSGEKSDFSGMATWAINSEDDWFLLNVVLRKRAIQAQYIEMLAEASRWKRKGKYVELGVEIDGNQQAHVNGLEVLMAKNSQWFSFARQVGAPQTRKGILNRGSGVNKHERFRIVSTRFLNKKVWFPEHLKESPDMIEFVSQIKGATHTAFSRSDDGPDLVSMVEQISYVQPSAVSTIRKTDSHYDPFWDDEPEVRVGASAGYR